MSIPNAPTVQTVPVGPPANPVSVPPMNGTPSPYPPGNWRQFGTLDNAQAYCDAQVVYMNLPPDGVTQAWAVPIQLADGTYVVPVYQDDGWTPPPPILQHGAHASSEQSANMNDSLAQNSTVAPWDPSWALPAPPSMLGG